MGWLLSLAFLAGSWVSFAPMAHADEFPLAFGAGVGAVAGAVIGQSLNGRSGAIVGAGVGGILGASVARGGYQQQPALSYGYEQSVYPINYYPVQSAYGWRAAPPPPPPAPVYGYWQEVRPRGHGYGHYHGHEPRYEPPVRGYDRGYGRREFRD